MRKEVGVYDKSTGEVICDGYVAVIQPKRRNGFQSQGWAAMAQPAMKFIPTHYRKDLGLEGLCVFMFLLGEMDTENFIQVNQTELAKELAMQRTSVARAIKRLLNLKIIFEGPKVGRCRTYRLNPHVGWKGSANNHNKALQGADHLKLVHNRDNLGGLIG